MTDGDRRAIGLEATDPRLDTLPRPAAPREHTLVPGNGFGAYRIVRLLGRGGMGEVYEAHDLRLERSVAIKVISGVAWAGTEKDGRQRLTREAIALAKLSHPNIVAVHEIGAVDDELFVAMEYVDGGTLRQWLAEKPRATREILAALLAAGRGLAAAHGAGLVHRDFKPDNVLIDATGRVRVSDFGLVAQSGGARAAEPGDGRTVDTVGTPAYMSPEQHAGARVDARSDQYSFCVTLHEALYGRLPFVADTPALLRAAKQQAPRRMPARKGVSKALEAVLRRGLDPDPGRRFPSMEPILAALARDPGVTRRRVLVLAGVAALGAAAVYLPLRMTRDDPVCGGSAQRLAGVWDDAVKRRVGDWFAASGRPYGRATFASVAARLDEHLGEWRAMHRAACEATAVRREQSAAVLDLRMACLERRLAESRALVELFSGAPDPALVDRAIDGVSALGDLAPCADVEALAAVPALPAGAGDRRRVVALQEELARQGAAELAGRQKEALALATRTVSEARAVGYPPALAEALVALGRQQWQVGQLDEAERNLREALPIATRSRDDRLVSDGWWYLQGVVRRQGRFQEAALLGLPYDLSVERAGGDPARRATALLEHARTESELGDYAAATALAEQALALRIEVYGPRRPEVARTLAILSSILADQGQFAAALERRRLALAIEEEVYGRTHLRVASELSGIGRLLWAMGRPSEAQAALERGLALLELVEPPTSENLGDVLVALGGLEVDQERPAVARAHLERALALIARSQPEGSPRLVRPLVQLGRLERLEGHRAEARARLERALTLAEKGYGAEHPMLAEVLLARAELELDAARVDDAGTAARRALAIIEKVEGRDHRLRGRALSTLARAVCPRDAPAGLALAQQALALRAAASPDSLEVADALLVAGECQLAAGHPSEAAAVLARSLSLAERLTGAPGFLGRTRAALARARRAS